MSTLVARLRDVSKLEQPYKSVQQLCDDAAGRVEALEMTLVEMLAKCSFAKRDQWYGAINWHCVLARRVLREFPMQRRLETPDKINDAFNRPPALVTIANP